MKIIKRIAVIACCFYLAQCTSAYVPDVSREMVFLGAVQPVVKVSPAYPKNAAYAGYEGNVLMSFAVDGNGSVKNIHVEEADNNVFIEPAKSALSKAKFIPHKAAGMSFQALAKFRLNNARQ